jgi:phosphomannomutase
LARHAIIALGIDAASLIYCTDNWKKDTIPSPKLRSIMSRADTMQLKKVIIFDLDGTLTKSKSDLDNEMASLISRLLRLRYVAVTSGCSFRQFESQFLSRLPKDANLSNLFLFPTCSASGYYYDKKRRRFHRSYSNLMSKLDVTRILHAFEAAFVKIHYVHPRSTYGPVFENRGSQVTFSALGQKAPLRLKRKWDPDQLKRLRIRRFLKTQLGSYEVTIGGTTSIDVTRRGVNKTLCVRKLKEHLSVDLRNMLFIGDALFRGGNDHIMKSTSIKCVSVSGPKETKGVIRKIVAR